MLAFAADAGAFAALGGEDVGVAGVGVARAQIVLQLAGLDDVVGVVRGARHEASERPELGLDRVAQEALVGVKHNSTLFRLAHRRMARVLLAERLSRMT